VEEAAEADVHALFETNYFGALRVIQAALPLLRQQGSGHILGVSSSLGIVPMPLIGYYCATKAATESIHESLAQEVRPFGIKVTLLEPGAYATEFSASRKEATPLDAYAALRQRVVGGLANEHRGDPHATAQALFEVVDAQEPPLRFIFGSQTLPIARAAYAERLATWEAWEAVSNAAQGEPGTRTAAP
jgi:NAD(P)-dependent dehydrogenase (short-subunit alcohol dehydrogenase family)